MSASENVVETGVSEGGVRKGDAKQKRKKWSFEEKVLALDHYHKFGSKMQTLREFGIPCGKMLRDWLKDEEKIRRAVSASCSGREVTSAFRLRNSRKDAKAEPRFLQQTHVNISSSIPSSIASALSVRSIQKVVDGWLEEDTPNFDFAGAVIGNEVRTATVFAKSTGMLAGIPFFNAVFDRLGCAANFYPHISDGSAIVLDTGVDKTPIGTVTGPVNALLLGERPALNVLACCSGIATAARAATEVAQRAGWSGRLAGTRKTTPGFRLIEKYGMLVGGMDAHRMDLSSMVMLKDNHIAAAGSIKAAVEKARSVAGFSIKIDVECSSSSDAFEAAEAGADVVLLDNMTGLEFKAAAKAVKARFPDIIVEGSGGLTLLNILEYFCPEGDVLSFSVNRLAAPLDLTLKIVRTEDETLANR